MAKTTQTKADLIRDYLRQNPDKTPMEVVAALSHPDINNGYVSVIKTKLNKEMAGKAGGGKAKPAKVAEKVTEPSKAEKVPEPEQVTAFDHLPETKAADNPKRVRKPEATDKSTVSEVSVTETVAGDMLSVDELADVTAADLIVAKRFLLEIGGPYKARKSLECLSFLSR